MEFLLGYPIVATLAALAEHADLELVLARHLAPPTIYYRLYLVMAYFRALKRRWCHCVRTHLVSLATVRLSLLRLH